MGAGFGPTDRTAATIDLLGRFLTALQGSGVPLRALRAHGSLAGGDCQEGRSDLDLVAVLGRPWTPDDERRLGALHQRPQGAVPLAAGLHRGYLAAGAAADPECPHPARAHGELTHRPVTPSPRRELRAFGRVL